MHDELTNIIPFTAYKKEDRPKLEDLENCRKAKNDEVFIELMDRFVWTAAGKKGMDDLKIAKGGSLEEEGLTANTEAFALWVLRDKWDVWTKEEEWNQANPNHGNGQKKNSKFREQHFGSPRFTLSAGESSKKGVMSPEGMAHFVELCKKVKQERLDSETGEEMDKVFKAFCLSREQEREGKRKRKRIGDDGEEITEVERGGQQMEYDCFGVSREETEDFFSGSDWDFIVGGTSGMVGIAQV